MNLFNESLEDGQLESYRTITGEFLHLKYVYDHCSEPLSYILTYLLHGAGKIKFLNFSFQICLLFVPEMSPSIMSYIVQLI